MISSGGLSLIQTPLQERLKITDSPELAHRDFLTWGEDPDQAWVRYYVRNSKTEIYDWMTAIGTEFVNVTRNGAGNSVARFHVPREQGLGLVGPLYRELLRLGRVTFLFNHRVSGLTVEDRKVTGVRMENLRTGASTELKGRSVLLSTGGFAANLDLVRASWPANIPLPDRVLVGGGFFATGDGMNFAKSAGGLITRLDHQWNYASGLPDPFDPDSKRGFFTQAGGAIWVNAQGKRFVLEQHEPKATIPVIAAQKPAQFWAIFDEPGRSSFRIVHAGFTADRVDALFRIPNFIRRADTLEQLAVITGMPPASLKATIERYNGMVDAGNDSDFARFGPKAPDRGPQLAPRKIVQPPFYAAPMFILIRKSMGGIAVDTACRVLNAAGQPIAGLYAAGEATGFGGINGRHGLEGTFLGPSILMGRVAAKTVAAEVRPTLPAAVTTRLRLIPPSADPKLASSCADCHNLPALLSTKRPGYWHFEHSHQIVANRKLNCLGCHAEMVPFKAENHKIDRQLQTTVCQHCHVNPTIAVRPAPIAE